MKKKILIFYLILIITGISTTGYIVSELSQNLYKQEIENKLRTAATLIEHQISDDIKFGKKTDYNRMALTFERILDNIPVPGISNEKSESRITFVDSDGKVIGESDTDYNKMENHLGRKEIKDAISVGYGKDIRFSKTLGMEFIYVALPVKESGVILRVSIPLTQQKKITETVWIYSGIGIFAAFILTSVLAIRFSSSITKPVNELIEASKEISRGNYLRRAKLKSRNELGQLAFAFNEMAEELEKSVNDLMDKNIKFDSIMKSMTNGLIAVDKNQRIMLINEIACNLLGIEYREDITGKKLIDVIRINKISRLLQNTTESNESSVNEINISIPEERTYRIYANPIISIEQTFNGFESQDSKKQPDKNSGGILSIMDITNIRKLEQIRTEFVSNVTHELKTPLTSIRGFVETLRGGAVNDIEVADKFLEIIDIEAERLYMLINDILQLSEIETRQKDLNIARHELDSIIVDVFSMLKGAAEKKNVSLTYKVDGNPLINANRDRIKQMLINLIDNAIKYNNENGSIHVRAWKTEGRVLLSIKDTGIGIARQHIPRIFERFYRVDKGRSRSMGGTGLGLSIVKHIVNLYSGDIKVESEPGKGTEFIIQLPL